MRRSRSPTARGRLSRRSQGRGAPRRSLPGADEAALDVSTEALDQLLPPRLHAARDPVGEQHLVERGEDAREVARILVDEHALGDAAPEDTRLERMHVLP